MRHVEEHNPKLAGVLPKTYTAIDNTTIASLLRHINGYTKDLEGDAFGIIYEYFLAKFALTEGRGAGEFFTPASVVRLIVEVIEPFHGRIFDPACGSGGMFVHSAHFVERHQRSPGDELSIYGQEKTGETVRLAQMNLAIHGLSGEIREGNSGGCRAKLHGQGGVCSQASGTPGRRPTAGVRSRAGAEVCRSSAALPQPGGVRWWAQCRTRQCGFSRSSLEGSRDSWTGR